MTDTSIIYENFANLNPNFNGCSLIFGVENPSGNFALKYDCTAVLVMNANNYCMECMLSGSQCVYCALQFDT